MKCCGHKPRKPPEARGMAGKTGPQSLQGERALPADSLVWGFWPPNCERINFYCFQSEVRGTLFWQPQKTSRAPKETLSIGSCPVLHILVTF